MQGRFSIGRLFPFLLVLGTGAPAQGQQTVGLFVNEPGAFEGYTLFAPMSSNDTYLVDMEGKLINAWASAYRPGIVTYLQSSGHLLRTATFQPRGVNRFNAGGQGGRIEVLDWDSTLLWVYEYSTADYRQHHDIEELPNGNILILAWEYRSASEAVAAGRDPVSLPSGELWPEHVVEVQPGGVSGGTIVWSWHMWDHLIQDFDVTKQNFGVVADHPELIDINFNNSGGSDWTHANAIDYNPELDQIMISVSYHNELWVIDHSTTTFEAAGHTGGDSGKGGDLLYRWGNPRAYRRGTAADQQLFRQHDTQWIEAGLPGAGNILVFNNGVGRPEGNFSSVDELVPPVDEEGNYALDSGAAYGPTRLLWTYAGDPDFTFAAIISGAQRLPNGNTLICNGPAGTFREVDPAGEVVWSYVNPVNGTGPVAQGANPSGNLVFRSYRYAADDLALGGQDLTPGNPVEMFSSPLPVPDGSRGTTPLRASRMSSTGDEILVEWDASSCPAEDNNVIFGSLADVANLGIQGAECAVGLSGSHAWSDVPAGDLFFLVVGVDETVTYESSWGADSSGEERNATTPSGACGVTNKVGTATCL